MNFRSFLNESNLQEIEVYHVSPRSDMFQLRPTGSKKGQRSYIGKKQPGVYVAPKFKDAVAWAVSYVSGIKSRNQRPNERLKEKGGGFHAEKVDTNYKNLTIYQIKVPKEILQKSAYESFWEPEYFISQDNMDQLRIVKSKTYSLGELQTIYERMSQKRHEVRGDSINDIKKASKTNLAARYYLELIDLYNQKLMSGKKPVFKDAESSYKNRHLVHQEIEKLKEYIITSGDNWTSIKLIERLTPQQIKEVNKIYQNIKNIIESL